MTNNLNGIDALISCFPLAKKAAKELARESYEEVMNHLKTDQDGLFAEKLGQLGSDLDTAISLLKSTHAEAQAFYSRNRNNRTPAEPEVRLNKIKSTIRVF